MQNLQSCVKRTANGPLATHQISAQSVQPFQRYEKRVRTCICATPLTFAKSVTSGSLATHQISAQSVQPFPTYGKGFTSARTLACIRRPTFQKMLSIASVTRLYLLHILKPSTMPILKCIWSYLGSPHIPWKSQNFLNPHHYGQNFKIVVQSTMCIVRSFESSWWDIDTLNVAKLSVFNTSKLFTKKR